MSTSVKNSPMWAFLSLFINGVLIVAVILLLYRQQKMAASFRDFTTPAGTNLSINSPTSQLQLGKRHQLSYQEWLNVLKKEADIIAQKRPQDLNILVGDSLSLWFPTELLPVNQTWLNQGISGESSSGLLKRLNLFDKTQPESIFVMIGINDLIRGANDGKILENYQQILRYLRKTHPNSQINIQSILPHGGEGATWEGKDKLLAIANSRIQKINQQLEAIALQEKVRYLDLYPLFATKEGNLRPDLTTDGLHLSRQGYLVWSSALQIYQEMAITEENPQDGQQKIPSNQGQ
uniref:SGNH/GDSL hydrolase family protein n=2 Tax=Calothrix sp. PCC 6303 TaxID=1170562 RepID=UPI000688EC62|nr:SGNH/GDSL hydrolase family protein [Calothrix sp. PCC 6303]